MSAGRHEVRSHSAEAQRTLRSKDASSKCAYSSIDLTGGQPTPAKPPTRRASDRGARVVLEVSDSPVSKACKPRHSAPANSTSMPQQPADNPYQAAMPNITVNVNLPQSFGLAAAGQAQRRDAEAPQHGAGQQRPSVALVHTQPRLLAPAGDNQEHSPDGISVTEAAVELCRLTQHCEQACNATLVAVAPPADLQCMDATPFCVSHTRNLHAATLVHECHWHAVHQLHWLHQEPDSWSELLALALLSSNSA